MGLRCPAPYDIAPWQRVRVHLGHTGLMRRSGADHIDRAALRVRVGIALWLVSWIPFAVIFRLNGWAFLVAIVVEVLVGLVGLALAGSEVAREVRRAGWRQGLRSGWQLFRWGRSRESAGAT